MTFSDYVAIPAVNWSTLKQAAVSPLHYIHARDHDRPDTPAMAKGRAVHVAALEPLRLLREYTVYEGARRGKDWEQFKAVNAGKDILTAPEWAEVAQIAESVLWHPVARRYLRDGHAEQTLTWTDEKTGLACKARADFLTAETLTAVDLKTSRDISDRGFSRSIHDLMYHGQAAFYLNGLKAVTGEDWRWVFVAVESSPPYDVRVGPIAEDALWAGQQEVRRLLDLVAFCTEAGEWPGRFQEESEFDLPPWAYPSDDEMDDLITIRKTA